MKGTGREEVGSVWLTNICWMPTLHMVLWSLLTGQVNIFQDYFQIGEKEADMESAQVAS